MDNFVRFFSNSVPLYFSKFKRKNAHARGGFDTIDGEEDEEKSLLHSDYLCNILAGEQVARFYSAADNVEYLFKNGAFRIKLASDAWIVRDTCMLGEEMAAPISKLGVKLVEITSIMENLLQRDPFLFYTTGDRELISQLLIPLNKTMGKLERKITRLCQHVEDHRKVITDLASRYGECGDDQFSFIEADESETDSIMDTAIVLKTRGPDRLNKKLQRLWFFLTCAKISEDIPSSTHPHGRNHRRVQSKRLLCKDELSGFQTTHASQDFILSNTPYSKTSESTMVIDILCPPMDSSTANFIIAALTPPISYVSNSNLQGDSMNAWRKMSYEQVLQGTLLSPDSIETFDDFYTDCEENTRTLVLIQKKIDKALNGEFSQESLDLKCERHVSIKSLKASESGNQNESSLTDCNYERGSTCYPQKSKVNGNITETIEEISKERVECCVADAVVTVSVNQKAQVDGYSSVDKKTTALDKDHNYTSEIYENGENSKLGLKNNSGEYLGRFPLDPMTNYEYNVSEMLSYINDLTNCLRSLENFWLQPFNNGKIKGHSKNNKELSEIVDYLVFTINLLEDPMFSQQIYQEDRESIIRALKPVADSVTLCSNAFIDLTRLTLKDAQYLQKIMDHFPINDTDIVVYDHNHIML